MEVESDFEVEASKFLAAIGGRESRVKGKG